MFNPPIVIHLWTLPTPKNLTKTRESKPNKNDISVNEQGYLNNLSLRYVNEPARHKLLDVIGDLSLLGIRIKGKITAYKPGHKNNTKFAKYLKKIMKEEINKTAPKIDFTKEPLYNKEKIKSLEIKFLVFGKLIVSSCWCWYFIYFW